MTGEDSVAALGLVVPIDPPAEVTAILPELPLLKRPEPNLHQALSGHAKWAGDWVLDIRDPCLCQGIPLFFKQWGGVRKERAGQVLQGRTWDEVPGSGGAQN